ncbi:CDP-glycerol glycerophosphotransferase [Cytobacillus firmus]|uniref:CDP-glycerol glycerophosphotransferase n=2 Tax=Cytobacillus TaxID=2675230 RepID=A0A366JCD1_CYTFI|nr:MULTISPECIES: glycosyltransferase [Cytobacillus]RBP84467.1 CDP-glycerol glycerophosphotransferase [Cytobacillus firmus]TDX43107.1 CDP-glycerol glycerophosphotransferase [Cytobacillus oceanisediminis]
MANKIIKYFKRKIPFIKKPINEYKTNERFRIRSKYSKYLNKYIVRDNVILYESYHGKNFTGNPLTIFLKLSTLEEFQNYKHIIVVNENNPLVENFSKKPNVQIVSVDDDNYLKYLATAKYLINNTSFPYYFIKREGQIYINTWHGTPLKTLGIDINNAGMADHMNIQRNLLQTDFLISPNKFTYEKLLSSHDIINIFSGKIADIGYPRVDSTINSNREEVLSKLGIQSDKKVILYAPTWRGTVGNESDTSQKLLNEVLQLKERLGNDYIVLLKSHYFAYKYFEEKNLEDICIPNWFDTNVILAGIDILITDYSSIFFEFLPTEKTIIFYGDDIEQYAEERGFYLNIDTLPGPLCKEIEAVADNILKEGLIKDIYLDKYQKYKQSFCYNDDGNATDRLIDIIFRNKNKENTISVQTNKEKVLIYCGAFYNNGITMSALTLLDNIDYNKYEVVVIENPKGTDEKWNNIRKANKNVHFIYRPGVMNRTIFESYRHQWTLNRGISGKLMEMVVPKSLYKNEYRRIVGNTHFDYVINFGGYNDFWSLLFAFSEVKRKTIYLHNDMKEEFNKKIGGKFKHKKHLKVIFSTYKYYDQIVSVAKSTHETNFKNLGSLVPNASKKMTYINNLVNSKKVNNLKNRREYISYNGENYIVLEQNKNGNVIRVKGTQSPGSTDINLVTIGRLSPEKGHEKLIRAFYDALEIDNKMKLYIVGEGPLKSKLIEIINELNLTKKVFLVGQVENPFVLIKESDCFILSSNYEGQGLVLLETMIIGKPIIATDVTGVRSVLEGGYGQLIDNNESALRESIIDFARQYRKKECPKQKRFDYKRYNKQAMERFYKIVLSADGDK